METIGPILARQWKLGVVAFLIVLAPCLVATWQRPARYTVLFTFSAPTIAHRIQLPSLSAVNSEGIVRRLRLALEERSLFGTVSHDNGAFAITADSVAADSTDQVQAQLAAIHRQLTEQLGKDFDPTPLSAQLDVLEARLALIAQTLDSPVLSAYEKYILEDQAVELRARQAQVRAQLDIVSAPLLGAPASRLHRARQMGGGVLVVLGVVLSGLVGAAAMLVADALRDNA